jgi:hypothetical protein
VVFYNNTDGDETSRIILVCLLHDSISRICVGMSNLRWSSVPLTVGVNVVLLLGATFERTPVDSRLLDFDRVPVLGIEGLLRRFRNPVGVLLDPPPSGWLWGTGRPVLFLLRCVMLVNEQGYDG